MDGLIRVKENGEWVIKHDPSKRAEWMAQMHEAMAQARQRYREKNHVAIESAGQEPGTPRAKPRVCQHLGEQTGEEASCLCGNRGVMIPIYVCKLHQVECTVDPHKHGSEYRVCKRCDDGPWAMK